VIGVVEDGSEGWSLTIGTDGWTLGEHTFSARAQDEDDAWSEPVEVVVTVQNALPVIESLTAAPDPVTRPDELTLTAHGVSHPDGTVVLVEFSREGEVLGEDGDGGEGWSWSGSTEGWPVGEFTFSARALDATGRWSEPATVQAHVTSWQNPDNQFDVTGDGQVIALDVLTLVNDINFNGVRTLSPRSMDELDEPYLDVSGDGVISPIDVILVINYINWGPDPSSPEGEGEAVSVARRVWLLESPAGTTHVGASVWNQPEGAPGRMAGSDRPDEARMEWLVQAAEEARRRPAWSATQTILRGGRRSQPELTDELESLLGEAARARLRTATREHAELDAFFSALDNEL